MQLNEVSGSQPVLISDPAPTTAGAFPTDPHSMASSPSIHHPIGTGAAEAVPYSFQPDPRRRPLPPSVLTSDEDLPRSVWRAWAALGGIAAISLLYLLLSAKGVRPIISASGSTGVMTAFTLPIIVAFSLVGEGVKRGMPVARVTAYILCGGYALWNLFSFAASFDSSLSRYYEAWYQPWSVVCSLVLMVLPLYAVVQLASAEMTAWCVHRESERAEMRRLANR